MQSTAESCRGAAGLRNDSVNLKNDSSSFQNGVITQKNWQSHQCQFKILLPDTFGASVAHPGCLSRIRIFSIPDPRSRGQKDSRTGSRKANSPTKFRKVGDSQGKGGPNRTSTEQFDNLEHIESTLTQSVLWLLIWSDPKLFRFIRIRKSSFGSESEQLPILNEFEEKLPLRAGKIHDFLIKCTI